MSITKEPCARCGDENCLIVFPAFRTEPSPNVQQAAAYASISCSLARIAKCLEALEKREGK